MLVAQFTQLVWKDTQIFGIGYAECEIPGHVGYVRTIVVAQYYPGGNKEGGFKENVQKAITDLNNPSKLARSIKLYQRKKRRRLGHDIFD